MEYNQITQEQREKMDETITPIIEARQGNSAKILQLATDATRILSMGSSVLTKVKETGFFQRLVSLLPEKKRDQMLSALQSQVNSVQVSMKNLVTQEDMEQLRQYAWRAIESLNERNLLTADAVITVKNNLNSLAIEQQDIKEAVTQMARKVASRFERMENRMDTLEGRMGRLENRVDKLEGRVDKLEERVEQLDVRTGTIATAMDKVDDRIAQETWIANLPYDGYETKYKPAIRFLKVVKGFYLRKQDDYSIDVIKSLRRALKNVGLDPMSPITLGRLLDNLVEELQDFTEQDYIDITKVELETGRIPSGPEVSKILSVPSFVAVCWLPFSKRDLESTIRLMQNQFKTPYLEALQVAVKNQISERNGIDLATEETLFDLGVELVSCYSAIPKLMDDPNAIVVNVMTKRAMFCHNCGAKLSGDSVFCSECGTKME